MANGVISAAQQTQERLRIDELVVRLGVGFCAGCVCGPLVSLITVDLDNFVFFAVVVSFFLAPIGASCGCAKGRACVLARLLAVAVLCGLLFDMGGPYGWVCGGLISGYVYGMWSGRSLVARFLRALGWGVSGAMAGLAALLLWAAWVNVAATTFMIVAMIWGVYTSQ